MTMYLILLAVSVAAGIPLCSEKCGKWGRAVYCAVLGIAFIIVSASRFEVGYDYNSYAANYFNMKYMDAEDVMLGRMEKGFMMPLYALSLAFEDYYMIHVYSAVVIYTAVFWFIYKYSSKPWISVTAFLCFGVYFNSLNFLRQFMAALIILYAVKFMKTKHCWRFFVLTLVAALFHWSALIMLILFFLLKIKPSRIYLGIAAAGTVLFCIFSRTIMLWIIDHVYMYRSYDPDNNVEASMGLPIRYTIMFGILFAVAFIFRKRLCEKNEKNAYYINFLMFTVIFEAAGARHAILSRFALLVYLPPLLYLMPDLVYVVKGYIAEKLEGAKKKTATVISAAVSAGFAFGCYMILMLNNYNGVMPYQSQFNRPFEIFIENVQLEEDEEEYEDEEEPENDGADEVIETGEDMIPSDNSGEDTSEYTEDSESSTSSEDDTDSNEGEEYEEEEDYGEDVVVDSDALNQAILDLLM